MKKSTESKQLFYVYKHLNNGGSHFEIWQETGIDGDLFFYLKIAVDNMGVTQETTVPLIQVDQVEAMIRQLEKVKVLMKQPDAFRYDYVSGRVDASDMEKPRMVAYESESDDSAKYSDKS